MTDDYMKASAGKDGFINIKDEFDKKHSKFITEECDINGDLHLERCEVMKCFEKVENLFREEECPKLNLPVVKIDCDCIPEKCPEAKSCADIEDDTEEYILKIKKDKPEEWITELDFLPEGYDAEKDPYPKELKEFYELLALFDEKNHGYIEYCDIFLHLKKKENKRRDSVCPNYPKLGIECMSDKCRRCEMEYRTCKDLEVDT